MELSLVLPPVAGPSRCVSCALMYVLSLAGVFARDKDRREVARKVLAMFWRHKDQESR